jgi:FKBP-type peptidyl-prolyl cis-trans isomerase (trigger factor)
MKFSLTVPQSAVKSSYETALAQASKSVTLKGFRQGKAPRDLVEASLDKGKLYEQVFADVVPPRYTDYINAHQLNPIIRPKIDLKSLTLDQDWEIEVEITEKPSVILGKYQAEVKKINAKYKKVKANAKANSSDQVSSIIDYLLSFCQVEIPKLLIDESVQYSLSKLVDQVTKLGLTLDQYMASLKKTPESLKAEYAKEAERDLKMEFILEAIATAEKLHPNDQAIEKAIANIKDPETQKFARQDPDAQRSIRTALMRSAVIDFLKSL